MMKLGQLFDTYIAVDWSARNVPSPKRPSSDALWIGQKSPKTSFQDETYWQTRTECEKFLKETLLSLIHKKQRVIIGFDLDFGFPSGFVDAIGLSGNQPKWKLIWTKLMELIKDNTLNNNNRFEVASQLNKLCMIDQSEVGPLWGCPVEQKFENLSPKSPQYPFTTRSGHTLKKKRWTEERETKAQPVWKLIGSASVGGQTLVGIPTIYRLRYDNDIKHHSMIWPFETGFSTFESDETRPFIMFVEIWPGILSSILDTTIDIKDKAQVRATVDWMHKCDVQGDLRTMLGIPANLPVDAQQECIEEEGWVLGSGIRQSSSYRPAEPKQLNMFGSNDFDG